MTSSYEGGAAALWPSSSLAVPEFWGIGVATKEWNGFEVPIRLTMFAIISCLSTSSWLGAKDGFLTDSTAVSRFLTSISRTTSDVYVSCGEEFLWRTVYLKTLVIRIHIQAYLYTNHIKHNKKRRDLHIHAKFQGLKKSIKEASICGYRADMWT